MSPTPFSCSTRLSPGRRPGALVLLTSLAALLVAGEASGVAPAAEPDAQAVRKALTDGKFADAEAMARSLVAAARAGAGPDSLQAGQALDLLVDALVRGGKSADPESLDLARRSLAIKEALLGPEHPEVATSLRGLGRVFGDRGDYRAAASMYERAVAIHEAALGPNDPELARSLNALGLALKNLGEFDAALPPLERALAIRETRLGPDHAEVAGTLNNLANIHWAMGDYVKARSYVERAVSVWEKTYGQEHPYLAIALEGIGLLAAEMGDPQGAKPYAERALAISEKTLGPDHPRVGEQLFNLAELLATLGDAAGATASAERALRILEAAHGPDHPLVAYALKSLGRARVLAGHPEEARPLFERALRLSEQELGPDHPLVAQCLVALARVQPPVAAPAALDMALRAERISRAQFQRTARGLSEREALRYVETRVSGLDTGLAVIAAAPPGAQPPDAARRLLDETVRSRALVLDEMAARQRALAGAESSDIAPLITALDAARARLIRLVTPDAASRSPSGYRDRLRDAQDSTDKAERALAEKSLEFRDDLRRRGTGLAEVTANLPGDSALVAYVRYRGAAALPGADAGSTSAAAVAAPTEKIFAYAALVVPAGGRAPVAVPLGPAEPIDASVLEWRRQLAAFRPAPGRAAAVDVEARCREAGERVRHLVWDPVTKRTGKAVRVLIVPDGSLGLINFYALPAHGDRYLIETGPLLHSLSAERDIAHLVPAPARGAGLLALAASGPESPAGARRVPARCDLLDVAALPPLPGAPIEAEALAALWRAKSGAADREATVLLTGLEASKSAFTERARGRRVLHLATHGFFLEGDCDSGDDEAKRVAASRRSDPLALSGLVLSATNQDGTDAAGSAQARILTSQEIASLDLSGVEWAVLSACDTGVGRVQDGEGVLGMRRAFSIAGAGTVIMSLWEVEDAGTVEWMKALYGARLAGVSTADAMRSAGRSVIDRRRAEGRTTHPFYWGAFVAAGDWR